VCCSVKTDILSSGATSFLYIANANQHDSGNYTCALTDVADATISVHVLNGKCFRFLLAPPQIPGRIQSRKIPSAAGVSVLRALLLARVNFPEIARVCGQSFCKSAALWLLGQFGARLIPRCLGAYIEMVCDAVVGPWLESIKRSKVFNLAAASSA
jgi:hypothetical protein